MLARHSERLPGCWQRILQPYRLDTRARFLVYNLWLQLRYLQTLSTISAEQNSTIIFPMPINILEQFMGNK